MLDYPVGPSVNIRVLKNRKGHGRESEKEMGHWKQA